MFLRFHQNLRLKLCSYIKKSVVLKNLDDKDSKQTNTAFNAVRLFGNEMGGWTFCQHIYTNM